MLLRLVSSTLLHACNNDNQIQMLQGPFLTFNGKQSAVCVELLAFIGLHRRHSSVKCMSA